MPSDAVEVSQRGNQIDYLEPNTFLHLNLCLHLDLSFNSIRSIKDKDTFYGLWSLTTLSLINNSINQIEDGAFIELPSHQFLPLIYNELSEIRKMQLTGLKKTRIFILGPQ